MQSASESILSSRQLASIKGGLSTWRKHPEIFNAGRQKAILAKKLKAQTLFDYNQPLSIELPNFLERSQEMVLRTNTIQAEQFNLQAIEDMIWSITNHELFQS